MDNNSKNTMLRLIKEFDNKNGECVSVFIKRNLSEQEMSLMSDAIEHGMKTLPGLLPIILVSVLKYIRNAKTEEEMGLCKIFINEAHKLFEAVKDSVEVKELTFNLDDPDRMKS